MEEMSSRKFSTCDAVTVGARDEFKIPIVPFLVHSYSGCRTENLSREVSMFNIIHAHGFFHVPSNFSELNLL